MRYKSQEPVLIWSQSLATSQREKFSQQPVIHNLIANPACICIFIGFNCLSMPTLPYCFRWIQSSMVVVPASSSQMGLILIPAVEQIVLLLLVLLNSAALWQPWEKFSPIKRFVIYASKTPNLGGSNFETTRNVAIVRYILNFHLFLYIRYAFESKLFLSFVVKISSPLIF